MSGFLTNIARQALGERPPVRPVIAPLLASRPSLLDESGFREETTEFVRESLAPASSTFAREPASGFERALTSPSPRPVPAESAASPAPPAPPVSEVRREREASPASPAEGMFDSPRPASEALPIVESFQETNVSRLRPAVSIRTALSRPEESVGERQRIPETKPENADTRPAAHALSEAGGPAESVRQEALPERVGRQEVIERATPALSSPTHDRQTFETVRRTDPPRREREASPERESQTPPVAPTIQITIGRVEVRAVSPAPPAPKKPASAVPKLSLEEYLRASNGGRR